MRNGCLSERSFHENIWEGKPSRCSFFWSRHTAWATNRIVSGRCPIARSYFKPAKTSFFYSCTSSARSEIETFNTLAIFESVLMLTPEYGFVQILLMVVNDISVALEREDILYPLLIATSLTRNLIMYVYSSHSFDYPLYKRTHLDWIKHFDVRYYK